MQSNDRDAVPHVVGHLNDLRQLLTGAGSGYGSLAPHTMGADGTTLREHFAAFRAAFAPFFDAPRTDSPFGTVEHVDAMHHVTIKIGQNRTLLAYLKSGLKKAIGDPVSESDLL